MEPFAQMLERRTVESLAAANKAYSWESSAGAQLQTAATVIAMRQIDRATTKLERSSRGLAAISLCVSIAALVVSLVK